MSHCNGKTKDGYQCQRLVNKGRYCHQHQKRNRLLQSGGGSDERTEMTLFFAPWCPWCHRFMDGSDSVWQQLKQKHKNNSDVVFKQIDCDAKPEMAGKFGVMGFPTVLKIKGNNIQRFEGDRTVEALERFMKH